MGMQGMEDDRDFPMPVSVVSDAKIQEVIGYVCWQYTAEGRLPKLKPDVDKYALYIGRRIKFSSI